MSENDEIIQPEPPSMDWLLTFADLVSLLITFFVLLYSMKVVDVQKWDELKGTFSGVFSIREPIQDAKPDKITAIEKIDLMRSDNLDYVYALLERAFKSHELLSKVEMKHDYVLDTLSFSLSTDAMFGDGDATLTGEGQETFQFIGDVLRNLDNRISVAVHTDPEIEPTRQFPSNWELTMLRAIRIAEIVEAQGVGRSIVTTAMADSRFDAIAPELPIAERYKQARRVEIILHGESDL